MKLTILAVLLSAALPRCLPATSVNFGTYLYVDGVVQSQFVAPSDVLLISTSDTNDSAGVFLTSARMITINNGLNSATGHGTEALLYDTLTFAGSDFQGAFGATYSLNLAANFNGNFSKGAGTIDSGGTGGRIQVYDGSTQIDSSVFADPNSLTNFLFINGPTPICAQGVNGPDFSSFVGVFSFNVSCSVTVSAAHPTVRILWNLPTFINVSSSASWNLNMLHTATLSLGDLGGRTVTSASGVFPGTQSSTTPEPNAALLTGFGIGALLLVRAARSKARALRCLNAHGISGGHHGASGTVACR